MLVDGVFVTEYRKLGIMQYDVAEPKFNEVRIKTKACGVCCWDSWLYRGVNAPGPMPYIIGHEGTGIVEKVGDEVTNVKVGDKVFCASGSSAMMCKYHASSQLCCQNCRRHDRLGKSGDRTELLCG
ncbi:MAG: hypothetical protein E7519_17175 [Ruminococcaceae bacterium]|nr:hypothetical protein [Oscillospiraceae bacterium]